MLQKSIESEKSATKKESIEMSSEEVREAKTELIRLSNDDKERELYNLREKANKDRTSALEKSLNEGIERGIEQGIEQGIEEGKKETKLKTAKKMLLKNLDIQDISELTELSLEEIEELR